MYTTFVRKAWCYVDTVLGTRMNEAQQRKPNWTGLNSSAEF
jgi:hypothetical protein